MVRIRVYTLFTCTMHAYFSARMRILCKDLCQHSRTAVAQTAHSDCHGVIHYSYRCPSVLYSTPFCVSGEYRQTTGRRHHGVSDVTVLHELLLKTMDNLSELILCLSTLVSRLYIIFSCCRVHDDSGGGGGGSGGSASDSGSGTDREMEEESEGGNEEEWEREECADTLTSEEDEGDNITSSTAYTAVTCSLLCMEDVINSSHYQVYNIVCATYLEMHTQQSSEPVLSFSAY